jgi:Leucine Rich repeat
VQLPFTWTYLAEPLYLDTPRVLWMSRVSYILAAWTLRATLENLFGTRGHARRLPCGGNLGIVILTGPGQMRAYFEERAKRRRRKLPTLRVRGLLVFVIGLGLYLGWMVHSARIQRSAVAEIERRGGTVWYSFEWSAGSPYFAAPPRWRVWLHREIGTDYFSRVTKVNLRPLSASDALLAHIQNLVEIEDLEARCSGHTHRRISDAGLKCLSKLYNLTRLSLSGSDITDNGLLHLRWLSKLRELDLSDTPITDEGLIYLGGAKRLLYLNLSRTRVTDTGVQYIERALPFVLVQK